MFRRLPLGPVWKPTSELGHRVDGVGRPIFDSHTGQDRRRGKDYLRWLLEQRTGQSVVEDPKSRDDCTIVKVPSKSVGFLTGYRGESLRAIEREAGTFMFTDGSGRDGPE